MAINWEEFKLYKISSDKKDDNFEILLSFLRSYYNITSPREIFETMIDDETAQLMLNKRALYSIQDLEKHLFRRFNE